MRLRQIIGVLIAATVMLASAGTASWADSATENPCDPANGRYICDGTEDQPVEGDVVIQGDDGVSLSPRAGLPSTGVSDDFGDVDPTFTGDDGISSALWGGSEPLPAEVQAILLRPTSAERWPDRKPTSTERMAKPKWSPPRLGRSQPVAPLA